MEGFTDHNVDGFDNFGDDDDNFLSASGRDRRAARKAVRVAHSNRNKKIALGIAVPIVGVGMIANQAYKKARKHKQG
jgi:hypothetical protein